MEINSNSNSENQKKNKKTIHNITTINNNNNIDNKSNLKAVNDNNKKNNNKIRQSDNNMHFENNNNNNSNGITTNKNVKKQTVSVKTIVKMNAPQNIDSKSSDSGSSSSSSSSNLSVEPNTTTTTTATNNNNKQTVLIKSNSIETSTKNRLLPLMSSVPSNQVDNIYKLTDENVKFIKPSEFFVAQNITTNANINLVQRIHTKSVSELSNQSNINNNNKTQFETNLKKQEADFENNFIFKIKKDSKQTDQPKYQCEVCSYYCNSIDIVNKHISSVNHKNNLESMKFEIKVRELEIPSDKKISNLSGYLIDFYLKNVISNEKLKERYDIYSKFKQKFLKKYPDAKVNMYGSTAYAICFNDSQVDVDIQFVKSSNKPSSIQILKKVLELIESEMNDTFELDSNKMSQQQKSNNLINKLTLETKNTKIVFNFTSELFSSAYKTSYLIKAYLDLDERARILAFCFRYIAKIAIIDKVDLCTLPPHSYILMTIYFLQKLNKQILPVLHETISSAKINNTIVPITTVLKKRLKTISLSDDVLLADKTTNGNENEDESNDSDDNDDDDEQSGESDENDHDWISVRNFEAFKTNVDAYLSENHWKTINFEQIGSLWLKLLAFYSVDFGFKKNFISVRSQRRIPKSDVKMYTKKLAIEDPFLLKQSLSRNLMTQTNKYIIHVISKTCLYFVNNTQSLKINDDTDLANNSKIVDKLIEETGILEARKKNKDFYVNGENMIDELDFNDENDNESEDENDDDVIFEDEDENYFNSFQENNEELCDLFQSKKSRKSITNRNANSKSSRNSKSSESDSNFANREKIKFEKKLSDNLDKILKLDFNSDLLNENLTTSSLSSPDTNTRVSSVPCLLANDESTKLIYDCLKDIINKVVNICEAVHEPIPNVGLKTLNVHESYNPSLFSLFKLTSNALGFQKYPPKICSLCNKEGHLDKECPQDCLPKLEKLPDMTKNWRDILDYVTFQIMEDNQQTKKEESERNLLFEKIKSIVAKKFSDANLSLFGSSNNGFGMKKSDLDICMTLDSNFTNGEKISVNFKRIIRVIGSLFRQETEFYMVEERISAKVPIVKFRHKKTNVEGDISLYNTLALQNTELIRTYAMIDERTKVLGHVVKYFAKICNIGDASCGSLSSYAYIVMVLHYLMNTSPPVLPCLQKLNRDNLLKKETTLNIDGWDCWFNKDISNLATMWPHYKANKQSVGELWLGFLCYYTEKFDWNNNVVCIRDNDILTRRSKNWTKHRLAIEDPFELSHNLAAGVSHKMGLYILKSFAKARSLFGTVIHDFNRDELRLNMEYFFNPKSLVDGIPPIGRNCFTCNKIGHQTRECPVALSMRKARQLEKKFKLENRRFMSENNADDFNNSIICYRCRNSGHMARECPNMMDNRSQKQNNNNNNNNSNNNMTSNDLRCFTCNQFGHYSRDCTNKNKQVFAQQQQQQRQSQQNYQIQQQQQQQQQQQLIIKQQSAPQPKMIRIVNSNPNINPPMLVKTSENNFQLLVNKNDQHNVYSNYQNFYMNQSQPPNNNNNNNSSSQQQYQQSKNDEISMEASSKLLKSSNNLVYNNSSTYTGYNYNIPQYNQQYQFNNNNNSNNSYHKNINYTYQIPFFNNGNINNASNENNSEDLSQYLISNNRKKK